MTDDIGKNGAPRDRAIRVCFVIDRLSRAGTESQLLLLLKQLDRERIEPSLCLLDGNDDVSLSLLPRDCPTLRLGVRRLASFHALQQAWRFWRFLKRERVDIVQTYFPDSTRFAAPIARAAGVRAVFGSRRNIGHWMTPRDAQVARWYNRLFIDKIIANCEAARLAVIEQEGAKPDQVVVLPNAIDLERFKDIPPWQPKPPGQPRKIGMVGNLRPVKGIDLFIRAAQLVLKEFPDTRFEIAGGGDPAPYQALIEELGLTNNVRLLGEVVDVPAFLATLDVAVLPSRAEGYSNALLEYMAAGRPIVATNVGGNLELVKHGLTGLLVEPIHNALSVGINQLQSDLSFASQQASCAFNECHRYGITQLIEHFEDLCESYVQSHVQRHVPSKRILQVVARC